MHGKRHLRGFTLVELLVALFALALLAVMSWRGLDGMTRAQAQTEARADEVLALQVGLSQWSADLDAIIELPRTKALDWNGRVLRMTRRSTTSVTDGVLVAAWTRRIVNGTGTWLRWQSLPVTTRGELEQAWQEADTWSQNAGEAQRAREVTITPLAEWKLFYFRENAWTNPQSSELTSTSVVQPPLVPASGTVVGPAKSTLPDGVRLVLTLPPGQAISGTLTRDWVRLLLREDHINQGPTPSDHLGEPWAVPLQEARLASFLAAERNVATDVGADVLDAFLSGQIMDLQSLINVNNLVDARGEPSKTERETMARLFNLLGLPASELDRLSENLRFAGDSSGENRSAPEAPLRPQKVEQLVWLGLSPQTVAVLQPYVTLLPRSTKVNLNTASAEVIFATGHALDLADAQRLVQERERSHFRRPEDAQNLFSDPAKLPPGQSNFAVETEFFEVRARLRLNQLVVEERSILERPRGSVDVSVVQRERGAVDPAGLSQAAFKR